MRHRIFASALGGAFLLLVAVVTGSVAAATHIVDPAGAAGAAFTTVSDALAVAAPGDTVRVRPGTYDEELVIRRPLTLEGAGPAATIFTGDGVVLQAKGAKDVTIRGIGFVGKNPQAPIVLLSSAGVTIERCEFTGRAARGLEVQEVGRVLVRNCRFVNLSGSGAFFTQNTGATVRECVFSDNGQDGVVVGTNARPTLERCVIQNSGQNGLHVYDQGMPIISNTIIQTNRLHGVLIASGGNPRLDSCKIMGNAGNGIFAEVPGHPRIEDCVVRHNLQRGIEVRAGSITIRRTTVLGHSDYQPAVLLEQGTSFNLRDNVIAFNGFSGILVREGAGGKIIGNTVYGNRNEGIWLKGNARTTIAGNIAASQYSPKFGDGIRVWQGQNVSLSYNLAGENGHVDYRGVRVEETNFRGNPEFRNPDLLDFTLGTTSPAKGVGPNGSNLGAPPNVARIEIDDGSLEESLLWSGVLPGIKGDDPMAAPYEEPTPDAPRATPTPNTAIPVITIFSEVPERTDDRRIDFAFTVETPEPLDEIGIVLNGKHVVLVDATDEKALRKNDVEYRPEMGRYTMEYRLNLLPGPNRIEIRAENNTRETRIERSILRVKG